MRSGSVMERRLGTISAFLAHQGARSMEIIQLKIVKEIYAARSLSKASMRLGKAQSIVSRHLTAFEKECGGRVFHRTGRGVQLTELGEQILPQIDLIIQTLERMVACGKSASTEITGSVRVTVTPAISECLVPALFASIQHDYPLLRLQFFEGYSSQIDDALEKGETDVAIFLRNGVAAGSNHDPICHFDTFLISLPSTRLPGAAVVGKHEVTFADLEGLPLLMPSEPSFVRHALNTLAESRGFSLTIAAEVNSLASMQALFEADAGYLVAAVGCGPAAETGEIGRRIRQGKLKAARIRDPDVKRTLVVGTAASVTSRVEVVRKAAVRILRDATEGRDREPIRTFGT
jgi:LysR family transcriptional regulator, nitrogen assimilation regulatory protein